MDIRPLGVFRKGISPARDTPPAWDLGGLYASPEAPSLTADLSRLEQEAAYFASAEPDPPSQMARREKLEAVLRRVMRYPDLMEARGESHAELRGRIRNVQALLRRSLLGFDLALGRMSALPAKLERYAPIFDRARRLAPSRLDLAGEAAAADFDDSAAWADLHGRTLAGLRLGPPARSVADLRARMASSDPAERRLAAEILRQGLSERADVLACCLSAPARTHNNLARLRGQAHWLDETCIQQGLSVNLAEQAVTAVVDHSHLAIEFFDRKRRALGLDAMREHDRTAPWPGEQRTFSWKEAVDTVLKGFDAASPKLADAARRILKRGRVQADPAAGGHGGPFCLPVDGRPEPFVNLRFHGGLEDVLTLAHELAHGAHHVLAHGRGSLQDTAAPAMAETAACLGEELVLRRLADQGLKQAGRHRLERAMTLVFRQAALLLFEAGLYEAAGRGIPAPDALDDLWRSAHQTIYGRGLSLSRASAHDWAVVPHFHFSPGYVLAYVLGWLAACNLSERLCNRMSGLEAKLIDTLSQGMGPGAEGQFRSLGLVPEDPWFIDDGLAECQRLLDQLDPA